MSLNQKPSTVAVLDFIKRFTVSNNYNAQTTLSDIKYKDKEHALEVFFSDSEIKYKLDPWIESGALDLTAQKDLDLLQKHCSDALKMDNAKALKQLFSVDTLSTRLLEHRGTVEFIQQKFQSSVTTDSSIKVLKFLASNQAIVNQFDFLRFLRNSEHTSSEIIHTVIASDIFSNGIAMALSRMQEESMIKRIAVHSHAVIIDKYTTHYQNFIDRLVACEQYSDVLASHSSKYTELFLSNDKGKKKCIEYIKQAFAISNDYLIPTILSFNKEGISFVFRNAELIDQNFQSKVLDGIAALEENEFMRLLYLMRNDSLEVLLAQDSEKKIAAKFSAQFNYIVQEESVDAQFVVQEFIEKGSPVLLNLFLNNNEFKTTLLPSVTDVLILPMAKKTGLDKEKAALLRVLLSHYQDAFLSDEIKFDDYLNNALELAANHKSALFIREFVTYLPQSLVPEEFRDRIYGSRLCDLVVKDKFGELILENNSQGVGVFQFSDQRIEAFFASDHRALGTHDQAAPSCAIEGAAIELSDMPVGLGSQGSVPGLSNVNGAVALPSDKVESTTVKVCSYETHPAYTSTLPAVSAAVTVVLAFGVPLYLGAPFAVAINTGVWATWQAKKSADAVQVKLEGQPDVLQSMQPALPAPDIDSDVEFVGSSGGNAVVAERAASKKGSSAAARQCAKAIALSRGDSSVSVGDTTPYGNLRSETLENLRKVKYKNDATITDQRKEIKVLKAQLQAANTKKASDDGSSNDGSFLQHAKVPLIIKILESGVVFTAVYTVLAGGTHYLGQVPMKHFNCNIAHDIKACHMPRLKAENVVVCFQEGDLEHCGFTDSAKLISINNKECSVYVAGADESTSESGSVYL
jgi:hypothetical protein